ncbi:MAG: hypothetical protein ACO2YW_03210, partial [Candidatus Nanopelagicaceae bacterium]
AGHPRWRWPSPGGHGLDLRRPRRFSSRRTPRGHRVRRSVRGCPRREVTARRQALPAPQALAGLNAERGAGRALRRTSTTDVPLAMSRHYDDLETRDPEARERALEELAQEERTLIFFEAPHRINSFLDSALKSFGSDRRAAICREMTKT